MRNLFIISAIAVQFLILGQMAAKREWILRTAPTVWLRTAPVDPRDLFRGDYVRLGYEIGTIPPSKFSPELKRRLTERTQEANRIYRRREIVVYVSLAVTDSGVAEIAGADLTPPATGLYIKGRARPGLADERAALWNVAYGIDAWYVQQGKGRALERRAPEGAPDGVQVPMEMQVALGRGGEAALKDYRWSPLGIRFDVTGGEPPRGSAKAKTEPVGKTTPKKVKIGLYNASPAPLAVVLPADLSTFRIRHVVFGAEPDAASGADGTPAAPPADADVRVLQPRESVTVEIDPHDPRWFVRDERDGKPRPLGAKDGYANFQVVYAAPAAGACAGLREQARIWHGTVVTRTFSDWQLRDP